MFNDEKNLEELDKRLNFNLLYDFFLFKLPNAKRGLYYVVVTLKDKTITNKMVIQ